MLRLRTLGVVLSFGVLSIGAPTADAESRHLSLGEVAVSPAAGAAGKSDVIPSLKIALDAEMRELDLRAARKDAVLSVSLVKLETEQQHTGTSATCVISATLRSRDGGAIFAILEGRARAQGQSARIHESALRGAVHGALSRVPEALK